jgi:hypothetical protein
LHHYCIINNYFHGHLILFELIYCFVDSYFICTIIVSSITISWTLNSIWTNLRFCRQLFHLHLYCIINNYFHGHLILFELIHSYFRLHHSCITNNYFHGHLIIFELIYSYFHLHHYCIIHNYFMDT